MTLYNLQQNIENSFKKTYKVPQNFEHIQTHFDLLKLLLESDLKSSPHSYISVLITRFIQICNNKQNINLYDSEDNLLFIIKNFLSTIDLKKYKLIKLYNKHNKNTPLCITLNNISLEQYNFNFPMVIEPIDWTSIQQKHNASYGGYLNNNKGFNNLYNQTLQSENLNFIITDDYINIINKLQKQAINSNNIKSIIDEHQKTYNALKTDIANFSLLKKVTKKETLIYYDNLQQQHTLEYLLKAYNYFYKIIMDNNIKDYYFTFNVCFRGRLYINGLISPTSDKILRSRLLENVFEYDATASVLQILSMNCFNKDLLEATNLLSNTPNDPWTCIFQDLFIEFSGRNSHEHIQFLQECLDKYFNFLKKNNQTPKHFNVTDIQGTLNLIDRNMIKYTVMRVLYGSNAFTIAQEARKEYQINSIGYKHLKLILAVFYAKYSIEYECLKLLPLINKYHLKIFNTGLHIDNDFIQYNNTYYKHENNTLKFTLKGKRHEVIWFKKTESIDIRKSNKAMVANLFHSIDANICINIIKEFINQKKFIVTIHDAFIVSVKDEALLKSLYNKYLYNNKFTLIEIFKKSLKFIPKNDNLYMIIQDKIQILERRFIDLKIDEAKILNSLYSLKKKND